MRLTAQAFSLVVSDTTASVKKCRQLICEKWPWILNCPDPCHQLNLMMKDIMLGSKKYAKIKGFAEVMCYIIYMTAKLMLSVPIANGNHLCAYNLLFSQ
jgi:hypothetical protein